MPVVGQTVPLPPTRIIARMVAHEVEISEGCGLTPGAPPRKLLLQPGQPLPIPGPLSCDPAATLRFNRFRLAAPLRSEAGTATAAQVSLDAPFTVAYDISAEWTGGQPAAINANVELAGTAPTATPCADSLSANLNAQTSRVCEWMTLRRDDGFTVNSQFSYSSPSANGPRWMFRSTIRYAWTTAPSIERVEFVQATQSEDQRVPLFAGKPTHLRIFPAGAGEIATRVQVQVRSGAGLWRFTTARSVIAPGEVNRSTDAQSFLIPLPQEAIALAGTLTVDAQLQSAEGRLLTALTRPVTAEVVDGPRAQALGFVQICETTADGRERICPDTAAGSAQVLGAMVEQILPVAALPQLQVGAVFVPAGSDVVRRLGRLRLLLDDLQAGPTATLAAVLPARGEWAAQLAGRWSPAWRMAFSSDAANGPEQLAGAMASLFGVPAAAGSTAGAAGLDLRSGAITLAERPDLGGAAGSWVSPSTVTALAARMRAQPAPPSALGGVSEFLNISGTVSRDGLAGTLGYGFRVSQTTAAAASDPNALTCLRLTSASGETARTCFTVERLLDEKATEDAFAVRIPWLAGTRQVTLLQGNAELASLVLSATPPQAELLTPQVGNRIPNGPITLQWTGSDADGDALRYDLLISTDGGSSWLPIACDLDRTDFTIDSSLFPTSSRVLIQLRFSDGLQSAAVTSGQFELIGAGLMQVPAAVAIAPIPAGQSAEVLLPITNTGNGSLIVQSVTIGNPAVQLVAPMLPEWIAPGATRQLRMRVTPPSPGAFSAALTVESSASTARLAITGRGANSRGPQLEIAPSALDFGTVALTQSRDLGLTIGNAGGAVLTVAPPKATPGFRVIGLDNSAVLPPGGQQQVTVSFSPLAVGSTFETLTLESDDPLRRTGQVGMAGHAIELVVVNAPKIEMRPAPSADFGNVRIGVPAQQTFTVRNSGRAPLVITRVSTSLADYSVREFPALPFTLAPNTERIFLVRLDAAATGARLGQLQVASNDPVTPVLNIGLSAVAALPTTGTVVLQIDDGTFERQAGFASGDAFFLSRLKPPAYPATLKAIRIYLGERSLQPGEGFGLLWAAHPAGTEELPVNLRLQSRGVRVGNPAEFVEYPIATPMSIESGDFMVGFTAPTSTAMPPAPLDTSTNLMPTRSYASRDGGTFLPSVLWPGFPSGVFAVRAVVDLGVRVGN